MTASHYNEEVRKLMSKQMTPKERIELSIQMPGVWLENFVQTDENGLRHPKYSEEEQKVKRQFPNFAAAFGMFLQLWKDLPSPKRENTFEKMETLIKNVIVMDSLNDWRAYPAEVRKWYEGKLCEDYKYPNENDRLFYDWILKYVSND